MAQTTRDQMLDAAKTLFAERGFYGVSIANIAGEVGLTKQALLHHFSTKEKLYGEVLENISQRFKVVRADVLATETEPEDQLRVYLLAMVSRSPQDTMRSRLLMRELLDNKRRAGSAGVWYLKDFLEDLVEMVSALKAWRDASDAEALAAVYQLLGAINYYAVSEPTLRGIFGDDRYEALDAVFTEQLSGFIRKVAAGPSR
ncbi:MAG: TetR/AcrR family transcriptional regulator [Pseudomonadota bacterium]